MLNATAKVESDYPTEQYIFIRLLSDNQNLSEPQQTKEINFETKKSDWNEMPQSDKNIGF